MKKLLLFGLFVLSIFFVSCSSEEEPTPLERIVLDTGALDIDAVPVSGQGLQFRYTGIAEYVDSSIEFGHIISKQSDFNLFDNHLRTEYNNPEEYERYLFSSSFFNLELGTYYIKAYATDGNTIIYGEIHEITIEGPGAVNSRTFHGG